MRLDFAELQFFAFSRETAESYVVRGRSIDFQDRFAFPVFRRRRVRHVAFSIGADMRFWFGEWMGAIVSQAVVALYFDLIRGALDASTTASRKPIGGTGFFPAAWLFYFCRCFGDAETAISRPIDE